MPRIFRFKSGEQPNPETQAALKEQERLNKLRERWAQYHRELQSFQESRHDKERLKVESIRIIAECLTVINDPEQRAKIEQLMVDNGGHWVKLFTQFSNFPQQTGIYVSVHDLLNEKPSFTISGTNNLGTPQRYTINSTEQWFALAILLRLESDNSSKITREIIIKTIDSQFPSPPVAPSEPMPTDLGRGTELEGVSAPAGSGSELESALPPSGRGIELTATGFPRSSDLGLNPEDDGNDT
ncbi:MAG TPA: hypothetical protein PK263_04295 [bacterium]|nr:hypothetical protein [bacterium]